MSAACVLKPDREFIDEIVASGGGDLKKCFQCATCSVVCELTNGRQPFPRKEMLWAQWGLKDRLMADPDIWMCYQCNDCSTRCPRGARPGDVLAAIRRRAIQHYAIPRFLADWAARPRYLPLLLLIPAVLLALALVARDPLGAALGTGPEHGFYAEFLPHWLLIGFFTAFSGTAVVLVGIGAARFWRDMRAGSVAYSDGVGIGRGIVHMVRSVLLHDRFASCGTQRARRSTHLTVFYGFAALLVVTMWAVADLYVFPIVGIDSAYPFDLIHPLKIVANVGALLLIYGSAKALRDRTRQAEVASTSTPFDTLFLWLLLSVGVTGVATEVLRFVGEPNAAREVALTAYSIYYVHLILVFALLVYLPYSKFAHLIYRSIALVFIEHSGRGLAAPPLPVPRAVAAFTASTAAALRDSRDTTSGPSTDRGTEP